MGNVQFGVQLNHFFIIFSGTFEVPEKKTGVSSGRIGREVVVFFHQAGRRCLFLSGITGLNHFQHVLRYRVGVPTLGKGSNGHEPKTYADDTKIEFHLPNSSLKRLPRTDPFSSHSSIKP